MNGVSGLLVAGFGRFGVAATISAHVYLITPLALFLLPETTGRPLPE